MEVEEIKEFTRSMTQIESFLSELAARDSELRYMGLGSAKLWQSYEEASASFSATEHSANMYGTLAIQRQHPSHVLPVG